MPAEHGRTIPFSKLVLAFYVPSILLAFSLGLLLPVLPLYAQGFGVSYALVGLVSAGASVGMLVGDLPGGMLVRQLGQKRAMLLGLVCTVLPTVALFWARSIPEAIAYRVLSGFGQAMYNVARHAYVTDVVHVNARGRAISLLGGLFRVGRFAGPLAGGLIAQHYGLRAPFLVVAVTGAAAAAAVVAFVEKSPRSPSVPGPARPGRFGHLSSALHSRAQELTFAGAGQVFAQMIRGGRTIILPLYASDVLGLDVQGIGLILSLSSAVDMLLFYPAGLIMDRVGRKWAIVPSFLVQALGMGLVPLTGSFAGLVLVSMLIGLGNGLGSGSMMTLGADLAPRQSRGEFLGIWRLIGDAGSSGGPLLVGGIADWVALPTAALLLAGAGLAAGTVFALFVPETLRRPQPSASTSPSSD
ncbi:MAG: MFS transporter [Anaerolineae bacterium]